MRAFDDARWIRGVAALEPTYVRNDEAAVALTWLAASPDDVELVVEGRYRSSIDTLRDSGPEASLVLADGRRLDAAGEGSSGDTGDRGWYRGWFRGSSVRRGLPQADVVAVELAWPLFRLQATRPLPPSILRDAARRAVRRG